MSSRPYSAAASSLGQKFEERSDEVHRKLGPSGHIADTKSYAMTSSTDAMAHNPPSSPSSRPVFPLRTILPLPPSLLDSSRMLSPGEEQTIRNTIHDINITLTSVDDEIIRVRATLSTLEEYRSTLQTTLAQHQGALSPIRKLPPEILGEVFLFSSDATVEWPRISGVSQADMPWVLCEICRYWRTVAISVPKLWSNIRLNLPYYACIEGTQHFFNLCLSRSKNALLTLTLHAESLPTLLPILDTFVSHCERWEDISLNIDRLSDLQTHLTLAKNQVPNLRRLHIRRERMGQDDFRSLRPLEVFEYAENLRELSMTHIDHPLRHVRVPWSQITHLATKGSKFSDGEFTQAMRHMTNLIAFSTDRDRIWDGGSTQPALLPHLRKLSITNEGGYLSATCQSLTVPALEEFKLSIATGRMHMERQIVAMIERSGCRPKRLTLRSSLETLAHEAGIENFAVVRVLSALPSLTQVELTVARADLFVLQALTNYGSTERAPRLPNLDSLVLEDRLCTSAFEIANALSTRIANDVRPESLSICLRLFLPTAPKPSVLDLLERLAENHGMEITILSD